jgi:pumilio RNA-binding family
MYSNNVAGHVVEFCKDQNGSRFLQARLDVDPTGIEGPTIMDEILQDLDSVKNDVFGNYVLQKLLEKGSLEMRDKLWHVVKGQGLTLSMLMYGCRVTQKAIESLPAERILELVQEFHGHVVPLIEDQNGNHVCQKLIEVLSCKARATTTDGRNQYSDAIEFIVEDVLIHIARLSCHPYGCRVLQRMLEHCIQPQKEQVLDAIAEARSILLDDQYGNYVIQHVLQFGRVPDREGILQLVMKRENGVLILSRQKFASNVVEKLLKYGTVNQRLHVLTEMLKEVVDDEAEGPTAIVLLMVRDPYANYVVQTTLDVVPEGEERNRLIELLTANAEKLRNYTYAKHIVAKICQ